jgi:hypothetical protein
MNYWKTTREATVEVSNCKSLLAAWRIYGPHPIVETYMVEKLTAGQFRRLPRELRARVKCDLT